MLQSNTSLIRCSTIRRWPSATRQQHSMASIASAAYGRMPSPPPAATETAHERCAGSDAGHRSGRQATMSSLRLPVMPPVAPMLAKSLPRIPDGALSFEPKWDGFRSIIFRDGDEVEIGSRNGKPMTRYFPEIVAAVRRELPPRCVVDGEIVLATGHGLDFEALQLRLHPATSRVALLADRTPASFIAFDLLALGDEDLTGAPFARRRELLADVLRDARAPVHLT